MGDPYPPRQGPPVPIAPAPVRSSSNGKITPNDTPQPVMSYACQTCTRRKVKCDKLTPICSSCSKGKLECFYQAPPPRKRKRKLSGDGSSEKLAQYEQILHQHGLLPQPPTELEPMILPTPIANREAIAGPTTNHAKKNEPARVGKLLAGPGKSRYVDSNLWRNLGVDEMMRMSDDEDDEDEGPLPTNGMEKMQLDPFSGALLGITQTLTDYHPSHADAMRLWQTHKENVEPICKVLHIPTVNVMVEAVTQQPAMASKADEALLFAIYHFAVVSMDADDCMLHFGQTREAMMQKYSYAIRQALVNAQVLKTTEMQVLQAYLLWLISIKNFNDPHTYWMLTGMLVRIAQRMGLHRDGETMGLPPFQVQMRRRLFYQVIPLDGYASQVSGTGISIGLDTWDTKQPLNINDEDIWPEMTEPPKPREGATDMIFCLTRAEVGKHMAMAMRVSKSDASWDWKDDPQMISKMVDDAETSVETKFLRYCDIITPLHYLTLGMARAALHGLRLRARLPKVRTSGATDAERREVFHLAMRVMDTDTAAYNNTAVKRFLWHIRAFFHWDALVCIIVTLRNPAILSPSDVATSWSKLEHVFANHHEILQRTRGIHIAIGRLVVKAWDANHPPHLPEPVFVATFRSGRRGKRGSTWEGEIGHDSGETGWTPEGPSTGETNINGEANAIFGSLSGMGADFGLDFDLSKADDFWDTFLANTFVADGAIVDPSQDASQVPGQMGLPAVFPGGT